jgi:hypothetical protein
VPPDAETIAALSDPAKLARISLEERPDLNTPSAISAGPFSLQEISTAEFEAGLRELEDANLAVQGPSGWQLINQVGT